MARNIVATSQPLAATAGLLAMRDGGNAADAALAMAIALTVVEPTSNGIGSDAFALIWQEGKLHGLNASGRSPAEWTPERFADHNAMPEIGWDSVTTPGCVSAWRAVSERFGKLPFESLFAAAIHYADAGFAVSPITANSWARQADNYQQFDEFRRVFMQGGEAPAAGKIVRLRDHAETLREIAETRGESFYRGELARKIAAEAHAAGGALSEQDLAAHECFWAEPLSIDYRGVRLHENPPNGQGLAALIALGVLRQLPMSEYGLDTVDFYHVQIEAMKLALADAYAYLADPDFMKTPHWDDLLKEEYLARRAELISLGEARAAPPGEPVDNGTVYLTAADEAGMMVSFIQSNFDGFGSGIVIPETGIALQNRGSGFSLAPGHPNRVGPRKRPFHTIIPGFVTKNGEPLMSFGVMGGPMQAQGHTQMIVRMTDFDQNPQAASDAPRWRALGGLRVALEEGTPDPIVEGLRARGHAVEIRPFTAFGGGQYIVKTVDGYIGASDSRKDGCALGW